MAGKLCFTILLLTSSSVQSAIGADAEEPFWLDIDTTNAQLTVRDKHNVAQASFGQISIGRGGASKQRQRGDLSTPIGDYRITSIQPSSRYGVFIALNYPNRDQAEQARQAGRISTTDYRRLLAAEDSGATPPADTALGGNIGLHGLGAGDIRVHQAMNWTRGCVALTNQQVSALLPWIRVGTRVQIR